MAKTNSTTFKKLSHIRYWSVSIYQFINNGDSKVGELWSFTLLHASNMSPLKFCSISKAQRSCAAGSSANVLTWNISPVIWSWDRNFAWNEQKQREELLQAEGNKDQEYWSSHHRGCGCDLSCSSRETDPECKMRNAGHYDTERRGGGGCSCRFSRHQHSCWFQTSVNFLLSTKWCLYLQSINIQLLWSLISLRSPRVRGHKVWNPTEVYEKFCCSFNAKQDLCS